MLLKEDVVDLSQRLISGEEANFKFELSLPDATESMPMLTHDDSVWYKIGRVNMCTHNGTHVETPYHHLRDGLNVADFPLQNLIGPLVVLDVSDKKPHEMITLDELKEHERRIRSGDIVFFKTGLDRNFRSDKWIEFPYIQIEGIQWLIEKGVKCLGTDSAGIEDIYAHNQPGHVTLFKNNIPLVESLTHLEKVENGDYIVFILPLPIENGDASPVRVTAVKRDALKQM